MGKQPRNVLDVSNEMDDAKMRLFGLSGILRSMIDLYGLDEMHWTEDRALHITASHEELAEIISHVALSIEDAIKAFDSIRIYEDAKEGAING